MKTHEIVHEKGHTFHLFALFVYEYLVPVWFQFGWVRSSSDSVPFCSVGSGLVLVEFLFKSGVGWVGFQFGSSSVLARFSSGSGFLCSVRMFPFLFACLLLVPRSAALLARWAVFVVFNALFLLCPRQFTLIWGVWLVGGS